MPGDLARLAASLGADVPYFLHGRHGPRSRPRRDALPAAGRPLDGCARGEARGRRVDGGRVPLVRGGAPGSRATTCRRSRCPGIRDRWRSRTTWRRPVMRHHPELVAIRRALLRKRAEVALMCGSGSAVFGLFPTVDDARAAAAGLTRPPGRGPGSADGRPWRVIVTRFIGRGRYRRPHAVAGIAHIRLRRGCRAVSQVACPPRSGSYKLQVSRDVVGPSCRSASPEKVTDESRFPREDPRTGQVQGSGAGCAFCRMVSGGRVAPGQMSGCTTHG